MRMIDVHAHLESQRFEDDLDLVINRFREAGGEFIISSGTNPVTNRKNLEISKKYDCVGVSFGLYPIDAIEQKSGSGENSKSFDVDEELSWIEEHASECVAIGEIGLDYNWEEFSSEEMKEKQKIVFRKVLLVAKKINKTVVIHSRKAELDAIEILEEMKMDRVIMHCFNGRKSLIRRCIENGWSFSVPPVITRLEHFKMLVGMVPLDNLLTETDSPFLSPIVGERNEPANIEKTIKIISDIKGLKQEDVSEKILKNNLRIFGSLFRN